MYAWHDNRDSLDGGASPRSSASVGREMEGISGRKFQSGVCRFGPLIERYLGAGEGLGVPGGGDYRPEHKSQQSLNAEALREKSLRPPNKAEAPPVKAAGAGGLSLTFCCS